MAIASLLQPQQFVYAGRQNNVWFAHPSQFGLSFLCHKLQEEEDSKAAGTAVPSKAALKRAKKKAAAAAAAAEAVAEPARAAAEPAGAAAAPPAAAGSMPTTATAAAASSAASAGSRSTARLTSAQQPAAETPAAAAARSTARGGAVIGAAAPAVAATAAPSAERTSDCQAAVNGVRSLDLTDGCKRPGGEAASTEANEWWQCPLTKVGHQCTASPHGASAMRPIRQLHFRKFSEFAALRLGTGIGRWMEHDSHTEPTHGSLDVHCRREWWIPSSAWVMAQHTSGVLSQTGLKPGKRHRSPESRCLPVLWCQIMHCAACSRPPSRVGQFVSV